MSGGGVYYTDRGRGSGCVSLYIFQQQQKLKKRNCGNVVKKTYAKIEKYVQDRTFLDYVAQWSLKSQSQT